MWKFSFVGGVAAASFRRDAYSHKIDSGAKMSDEASVKNFVTVVTAMSKTVAETKNDLTADRAVVTAMSNTVAETKKDLKDNYATKNDLFGYATTADLTADRAVVTTMSNTVAADRAVVTAMSNTVAETNRDLQDNYATKNDLSGYASSLKDLILRVEKAESAFKDLETAAYTMDNNAKVSMPKSG